MWWWPYLWLAHCNVIMQTHKHTNSTLCSIAYFRSVLAIFKQHRIYVRLCDRLPCLDLLNKWRPVTTNTTNKKIRSGLFKSNRMTTETTAACFLRFGCWGDDVMIILCLLCCAPVEKRYEKKKIYDCYGLAATDTLKQCIYLLIYIAIVCCVFQGNATQNRTYVWQCRRSSWK